MRNLHPTYGMDDDERREHLQAIMTMQARMAKSSPRVVFDRKNDTINVITAKDGLSWKEQNHG